MTLLEAVSVRRSQRTYLPQPLERAQLDQLGKALAECNRRAGLGVRLVCQRGTIKGPDRFSGLSGLCFGSQESSLGERDVDTVALCLAQLSADGF